MGLELPRPGRDSVLVLRADLADSDGWAAWCPSEAREGRSRRNVGHGLTRWYLAGLLGCRPAEVPLHDGTPHERPGLVADRLPAEWRGLTYNRAHAGRNVWLAVTRAASVGMDVEAWPPRTDIDYDVMIRLQLPPSEGEAVAALPPAQRRGAAIRAWTRYEAWVKATGAGIRTSAGEIDPSFSFVEVEPGPGYVGSIATPTPVTEVWTRAVRPPPRPPG